MLFNGSGGSSSWWMGDIVRFGIQFKPRPQPSGNRAIHRRGRRPMTGFPQWLCCSFCLAVLPAYYHSTFLMMRFPCFGVVARRDSAPPSGRPARLRMLPSPLARSSFRHLVLLFRRMADMLFFLPLEGIEPICLQLFCHAPRQFEARREAHQLGFNQQCVLCVQQPQQLSAPCGIHVLAAVPHGRIQSGRPILDETAGRSAFAGLSCSRTLRHLLFGNHNTYHNSGAQSYCFCEMFL